jgi:lysosomal alpha-mannosidase
MLQDIYVFPPGFGFDLENGDAPFEDDPTLETFDGPSEYKSLDKWLRDKRTQYATDNLFVTFGMDFEYVDAFKNYENMDRMIEYFNTHHSDNYHF